MKKQNDIILISLVITIILLIVLVSVSINLILGENSVIQKIKELQEINVEQIDGEEIQVQKINNK